ncbi:MAG TPA: NAD-dependent epimerase/dehydratase family protein [Acidimicrobiales bacterium]|nr:NAD-dependent epimerase/dehydratase family protein [Acidimicrobiales bacterium]
MAGAPDTGLRSLASATCVVTGGLGFIGSNLARHLAGAGARVRVVDALVPTHGGDPRNLEGVAAEVVEFDLGDPELAEVVVGADVVFNVAGQVSHLASMTDPLRDLDLNVRSHLGFLETLRRAAPGVTVVLTSTRQVYGRPERTPVDETHPTRPVDVNGIDKLACEQLHLLYGSVHGLRTSALRLTNVYGPRQCLLQDDLGFLPVFVRRALEGGAITLYGDGAQRRDCLHVDDVCRALVQAATTTGAAGEVFNIGHRDVHSLRQIATILVEAADAGASVGTIPWPPDRERIDIGDFSTDATKARTVLGWEPTIDLRDGLTATVEFYREHPWYLSST